MGIFDDISWMCNARTKGVEYANLVERVEKCEREKNNRQDIMAITFYPPPRHYPVRAHRK